MSRAKLCLDPAHKATPAERVGDIDICPMCKGERLTFKADDPGLDDLMDDPPAEPAKRYIVWLDYGTEGWQPEECDTLEACYHHAIAMSSPRFMITSTEIKVTFTEAEATQ